MPTLIDTNQVPKDLQQELKETFGLVPTFVRTTTPEALRHWWGAVRDFQLSDQTALDNKTKELIGLGVAAQIPCHYCVLFHTEAARLNGATDEEVQESIFMASLTRMGSTILNGSQMDNDVFDDELQQIVAYLKKQGAGQAAGGSRVVKASH